MTLGILLFIGGCIAAGFYRDYRWIIYGMLIGINISIIGFMCYHRNRLKDVSKPDFYIWGFNMRVFSISMLAIQFFHGIVLVLEERKHR